jgi:cysteine desulfurase
MKVYFDNAATTQIEEEVIETILPIMKNGFGNPSSLHSYGRGIKSHIEISRKIISKELNCESNEIYFTSGGTESDNMAINSAVRDLKVKTIISSKIEHLAVLETINSLGLLNNVKIKFVKVDEKGNIDLNDLERILSKNFNALVSLMHANNEIGNILRIYEVADLCEKYHAYFHTDAVQTIGHLRFDLKKNNNIHFLASSSHKFHGPKGVGFLYINNKIKINSLIKGGGQERNLRGGTENTYSIVGMAKAFELSYKNLENHENHLIKIKRYMISELKKNFSNIIFNGLSEYFDLSLNSILSVSFPKNSISDFIIINLDILGVACSGGSACSSGSIKKSHVLKELNEKKDRSTIRFSFSRFNKIEEVDYVINCLKKFYN